MPNTPAAYQQLKPFWVKQGRQGHWYPRLAPCQRVAALHGNDAIMSSNANQPIHSDNHSTKPNHTFQNNSRKPQSLQSSAMPKPLESQSARETIATRQPYVDEASGPVKHGVPKASSNKQSAQPDLAAGHKHAQLMLRIMTILDPGSTDTSYEGAKNLAYCASFKHVCNQLASLCHKKGADLPTVCLVQQAMMLKKLHAAMRPDKFSNSPAGSLVQPLITAASKSYHMQHARLGTWSALLHNLLPLQTPTRSMQPVFGACWSWMAKRGETVWVGKVDINDVKPRSVAILVWALATAEYKGNLEPLIRGLNAAVKFNVMSSAAPYDWATTLWAAAKLNINSIRIQTVWDGGLRFMTSAISRGNCNMQDVSMCIHAASVDENKLAFSAVISVLATALQDITVRMKLLEGCQPRAFSSILMSISKIFPTMTKPGERLRARTVVELVTQELVEVVINTKSFDSFLTQQLVIAVTALSDMGIFDNQLYAAALASQKTCSGLEAQSGSGSLDVVCVLYAVAQTYPGLWHSLQLQLQPLIAGHQALQTTTTSTSVSQGITQSNVEEPTCQDIDMHGENGLVGSSLLAKGKGRSLMAAAFEDVEQRMHEAQELLACLEKSDMSEWSDKTLGNLIWAWAALLPSTYFADSVKPLQQSSSIETTDQQLLNLAVASKVVTQFTLRDVTSFSPAALTQLYTAYIEMSDRQLLDPHFSDLTNNTALIQAARKAWSEFTQNEERLHISKYQAVIAERARSLRWKAQLEACVPLRDGGAMSAPSDHAHHSLELMRVDILLTCERKSGGATAVAIEVDGAHHYLDPRWSYNGKTALRHNQLRRRVGRFVTIPVQKWRQLAKVEDQITYLAELLEVATGEPGTKS